MTVVVPTPIPTLRRVVPPSSTSITTASAPTTTPFTASFQHTKSEQPGRKVPLCKLGTDSPGRSVSSFSEFPPSFHGKQSDDGDLSPLAEKLLISAGSIGIFVIFGAIIYLVIRMKRVNRLARGEILEEEARWYGWRRNRDGSGPPPSYTSVLDLRMATPLTRNLLKGKWLAITTLITKQPSNVLELQL
ncbi:hypothetical protein EYC84_008132 [Monilinia fructicola]|uniref:Uncharacterized protein n=1 Tax=Monilinia fructicola TaxID=38448 RepID=A0A5M9JI58_MONFR|nr:hypothetical protein EYC84_008132 [Monilinia fructicola]